MSRATWIKDLDHRQALGCPRPSPLRRFWSHYFRMLSRIAYHQASRLVTLSDANRRKQLADGADPAKIVVVPNGVRWNGAERSFDCPCHGSRFDRFGHVLQGPAVRDLEPRDVEPQDRGPGE